MSILRYIVSLLCFLIGANIATGQSADTLTATPPGSKSWKPQALRIGLDLSQITRQIIFDEFTSLYELHADLGLRSYFVVVDYGHSESNRLGDGFDYSNKGNYIRMGIDANLLKNDPNQTVILFGLRYGISTFDDQLQFDRTDAFGNHQLVFETSGGRASWFEIDFGLKVKVWKQLYLGYTGRYKFGIELSGGQGLLPLDIPGYGQYQIDDSDTFGFNYYISWRIPFSRSDNL